MSMARGHSRVGRGRSEGGANQDAIVVLEGRACIHCNRMKDKVDNTG